jgi:Na+-translocating ferredoxin:NAD+ oxidoreductase RNF subunit RnfB
LFIFALVGVIVVAGLYFVAASLVRTLRSDPADDPLVRDVLGVLPGANCGACGCDTCFLAATEIARGRRPPTICVTGGAVTASSVAAILRSRTCDQVG